MKWKQGVLFALTAVMLGTAPVQAADVWMDESRITRLDTVVDFAGGDFVYSTSDPSIATTTAEGRVSFHREGYVIIYAVSGDTRLCWPYRVERETIDAAAMEEEVLHRINVIRRQFGLNTFSADTRLSAAARQRSRELEHHFAHERPDRRSWNTVLPEFGMRIGYSGENAAMGQCTAEAVVDSWMTSPGHRENILRQGFYKMGVGCHQGADGVLYWAQLFHE